MTSERIFADLAQLAGGAMGVFSDLRQKLKEETKDRMGSAMGRAMNQFDLVTQDDVERLSGMITKARLVQDDLIKRLGAIEKKLGLSVAPTKSAPTKAKAVKKSTKKKQ